MAMDFPNSPTVNQTFTVGDKTWKYTGTGWDIVVNRPPTRTVSDAPPTSPIVGDEWFNSLTGRTYSYFSSTWVEVNTNSIAGANGLNGVASASAPLVYNSTNNNISLQAGPTITDGITTNAGGDGQVLKLKARSSDGFNQIAWYNASGSNFMGLWQVNADSSINIVQNTTYSGTTQNFLNRLTIDSSGRVAMPYNPAMFLDGSDPAWYSLGAQTIKKLNVRANRGGFGWDTSTGRITIPMNGWYAVSQTGYYGGGTTQRRYIRLNGGAIAMLHRYEYADSQNTIQGIFYANANDYVDIYQDAAATQYYGSLHTYVTIQLIG